jgi:hypothetical protein
MVIPLLLHPGELCGPHWCLCLEGACMQSAKVVIVGFGQDSTHHHTIRITLHGVINARRMGRATLLTKQLNTNCGQPVGWSNLWILNMDHSYQ